MKAILAAALVVLTLSGCASPEVSISVQSMDEIRGQGGTACSGSMTDQLQVTLDNHRDVPLTVDSSMWSASLSDGSAIRAKWLNGPNAVAPQASVDYTVYYCSEETNLASIHLHDGEWTSAAILDTARI